MMSNTDRGDIMENQDNQNDQEKGYQEMRVKVLDALHHNFRPEFLNRVDEIVVFHSLTKNELEKIVEIQIERLKERLKDRRIELEITESAKKHLADVGYNPVYGARPLKRAIQNEIETPLSRLIVKGEVMDSAKVVVDFRNGAIVFESGPHSPEHI